MGEPLPVNLKSVHRVSLAEAMNPEHRSTMEDEHVVVDEFGGDPSTGFFGVYDGHGGRGVAKYLRTHLHDNVARELHEKDSRSVEECLKSAFLLTDIECSHTGEAAAGSTAVVCIVRHQGRKRYVFTANCGDARAVLCHRGTAVRLSRDHKATDADERDRISRAGGFVLKGRVMGVLAVARSFGDFAIKKYVTCEPYTSTTKVNAQSDFIIVACDGVWDVLSDQQAVDLVSRHMPTAAAMEEELKAAEAAGEPLQEPRCRIRRQQSAAQALVDAALARNSTDNITAMVVFLH